MRDPTVCAREMRNIIVTGGSRGLGLGIARQLAGAGHRVIAIARKSNKELEAAIEEVTRAPPASGASGQRGHSISTRAGHSLEDVSSARAGQGELHFVAFDLADIKAIPGLVQRIRKQHGPIYGLVNNAGIGTDGVLAIMQTSQIEELVRVNTVSPIVLTKYAVRSMLSEGGGRIVNVASIIGFTGYSGLSVYGATKASMLGFTRSLAREVGRHGVTVNAVAPGFVDTDMTQGMGEEQRGQVVRRSALRRLPEIDDVANAVEFLLSDKAKNITGTVLTVDAGSTA